MMEPSLKEILNQARNLVGQKMFVDAQKLYSSWLEKYRETPMSSLDPNVKADIALAYNNRGQLKYLHVDFEEAVKDYDRALEYDPNLASAYYNRGTIMYRMGDFKSAVKDMTVATTLSPENSEFQIGLQRSQGQLGTSGSL